jgi:DNA polymerase-3 subunit delta'
MGGDHGLAAMKQVHGHNIALNTILGAAKSGCLHHAWILAGPQGIGKASLARELALVLLAGEEDSGRVEAHNPAAHLFSAGTHPDYMELARVAKDNGDLARNIKVDQIRSLARLLATAPSISRRRVILIDSADDLERSAANALRSRCRILRLSPLNPADMAAALHDADSSLSDADIMELTQIGAGSPGKALALSGLGLSEMIAVLDRIVKTGDPINTERLALAKSLSGKAAMMRYEAFLELVPNFLAQRAKNMLGMRLQMTITLWERARDLAAQAIPLSLDPAATVVELCGFIAKLADDQEADLFA